MEESMDDRNLVGSCVGCLELVIPIGCSLCLVIEGLILLADPP